MCVCVRVLVCVRECMCMSGRGAGTGGRIPSRRWLLSVVERARTKKLICFVSRARIDEKAESFNSFGSDDITPVFSIMMVMTIAAVCLFVCLFWGAIH